MSLAEELAMKYNLWFWDSASDCKVCDRRAIAAINEALERAAKACEQLVRAPAHVHTGCHEADASAIREMKSTEAENP